MESVITGKACFLPVASEAIRATLTQSDPAKVLTLHLIPLANQVSRARSGARFNCEVSLGWVGGDWGGRVLLVDSRGYPLVWQFETAGKWLVKALSGFDCVVSVVIHGGAQVPAKWTPSRVAASVAKVVAVDVAGVAADAAGKLASVVDWSPGLRRTAVIDAARRMVEAAGMAVVVKALATGGALGDSPPVDPPPVDPPPVDPPPVDPPPVDPPPVDPPPVDPPPVDPPVSGFDMTGWTRWDDSLANVDVGGFLEGEFSEDSPPQWNVHVDLVAGHAYSFELKGIGSNPLEGCYLDRIGVPGEYPEEWSPSGGLISAGQLTVDLSGGYVVVLTNNDRVTGAFRLTVTDVTE